MPNFMMCQHSTKISGRLNIMLISTTIQLLAIGSVECRSSNGGGVPETPPTQQNRNNISKFWLITKTAKISTQGREPLTPDLLVLDFNGAPETQVQRRRWLLIQSSPYPPTKEKQKKHL